MKIKEPRIYKTTLKNPKVIWVDVIKRENIKSKVLTEHTKHGLGWTKPNLNIALCVEAWISHYINELWLSYT